MAKASYHVIASPKGGWSVKKARASRATKHFDTQTDAIEWARKASKSEHAEFVVHRKDGTVKLRDYFGNDPRAPSERHS